MPKSKEQPLNIGEILKAYFTMRSRSGYTDNTGDEAHDLLLSREGAEATKKAVASMRIDPSRIDVERYSSQHPVASNAENRARFSSEWCWSYGGGGRGLSLPNVGGGSPSGGFRTGGGF
jgi:hypothetical protein